MAEYENLKIGRLTGNELVLTSDVERYNEFGCFQLIEYHTPAFDFTIPNRDLIYQNLELIYGIGPCTLKKLRASGFNQLLDLVNHPRWSKAATELVRLIENCNVQRLYHYGASDLELLSFFAAEEIKFIDIETLGFYYAFPIFLIGILEIKAGKGHLRQLLARNYEEEKPILAELNADFRNSGVVASYNGRSFDLPYIQGRLRFHQLDASFDAFHLDLLRHTRKNFRSSLPNCRLATVEKYILNQERTEDMPGAEAPEYYQRFLDTGERRFLEPILHHNALDLLALAKIMGVITADFGEGVIFSAN